MRLGDNEIHIWAISLNQPDEMVALYRQLLSPDEQARVERLVFARDRRKFILARSGLRSVLGGYLEVSPEEISFAYGENDKPRLGISRTGFAFNLSHAHDLALVAVAPTEVGIDLEWIHPVSDLAALARRVLGETERQALFARATAQQPAYFFQFWTHKEALIKASGEGFSRDPQTINLPAGELGQDHWLRPQIDGEQSRRWELRRIAEYLGYEAALAIAPGEWQLRHFQLASAADEPGYFCHE